MSLTWTMTELISRFRQLTGLSSTVDHSDATITDLINDYYVNHFPTDSRIDEFDTFLTQALTAVDSGEYSLDDGVDRLDDPVTLDGLPIEFMRDRELFFRRYPENEQFVTAPTLAEGSSDVKKVASAAFTYRIQNYSYSKAAAETAFSGLETVPQNTYGAFMLKIDDDGDITIYEADDNATGYDSARLALEGLDYADSDSCYMGCVTVITTDAAGFVPGTTSLDDASLTVTYTDGQFRLRATPEAALLYGTKLYVRPKSNDLHELKALHIGERPTALTASVAIADPKHGPQIALGAAIHYCNSIGDITKVIELKTGFDYYQTRGKQDKIKRLLGQTVKRRF